MQNIIIIIVVILLVIIFFYRPFQEKFSTSGLAISDRYCEMLGEIYMDPSVTDLEYKYMNKLCGARRRKTIDFKTGNYYTINGMLV
uniref:Uncharacterized protein n=1 Tax=Mimivirus LCMiAC01 TaxID=2506608 RepID=A0A481Z0Z0_9VIRU|nr:MAG: hypothetical protein LCMiAC01_04270 [Mimivirus LCMiAC01]